MPEAKIFPAAPAASEPPQDNVVALDAAKQEGIEAHKAYVAQVTDLCTLASALDRVGHYVRANTPIDQVRQDLLQRKAALDVIPQHPLVTTDQRKVVREAWGKITDQLNARVKSK